ncbi:MAG: ECF RNA polymerase sigma factor SigK [Actinomycetia bacterium]|nr:ECF RNA polymerase sigma factor SigK [Actinomycetes bacterium]
MASIKVHRTVVEESPSAAEQEFGRLSTNELMSRVGNGEALAFEALYDRLAKLVFSAVISVLRDLAQSEEVTQEVFVELWRTAARFDPQIAGARTWALTLAHRRAVDRVRSAHASMERESRWTRLQGRGVCDHVAETAEITSELAQVRKALLKLTTIQREAISLAYFEGHTYTEVATLLELPLGTVKTRMRDGLIKLRSHLNGAPDFH